MTTVGFPLPERNSRFVNHIDVLEEAEKHIKRSLTTNQTIVISAGPGGGKTASAVELVHRVKKQFVDGYLHFAFSGDAENPVDITEVHYSLLLQLRVHPDDIPTHPEARRLLYQARTTGRSLLMFFDGVINTNQLRGLQPGPGPSLIVATETRPVESRDVPGYRLFVLDPLTPDAALAVFSAVAGAELVDAEPDAAAELVVLCDRNPLALYIVGDEVRRAAARRIAWPLRDSLRRLSDHGRRSALPLTAVFGTAYELLPDLERQCYRALGFAAHDGTIDAAAMAAVVQVADWTAEEALLELAKRYLVDQLDGPRFRARTLVRAHARELDTRTDAERDADHQRLLRYYWAVTFAADAELAPGRRWRDQLLAEIPSSRVRFADAAAAREWLTIEHANIRAAVDYAYRTRQYYVVASWCVMLWPFYEKEKNTADLIVLHEWGIAAARAIGETAIESLLHIQLGFGHYWLHDLDAAADSFAAGVRTATIRELSASAMEGLALVRLEQGRDTEAQEFLRRNHELALLIDDARRIAMALFHRAKAEPPDIALPMLTDAESRFRELTSDETENLAKVGLWRGRKLRAVGDLDAAEACSTSALDVFTARRRHYDRAHALVSLAETAFARADIAKAREHYEQALIIYTDLGIRVRADEVRSRLNDLD
ncbi:tetratricopeptide repeat protein [Nocardia cyriacigeorgica]|uniref:tetratricopeptide repeat protein n=1 Tax=Nocardia cyriacigeorgica TaxID=135487 RepID=UPI002454B7FD|nr:tetratricopeptide repeat protein [Nocardia cyriacigeorgica]